MNTEDEAKSKSAQETLGCTMNGVKRGVNEQIQNSSSASVVKGDMNDENTNTDRDFKKWSRSNRKQRLKKRFWHNVRKKSEFLPMPQVQVLTNELLQSDHRKFKVVG
jgi:hypothetical protein